MRFRFWRAVDSAAHVIYCPGMAGRRVARARWWHRIHLMPGWLLEFVCDQLDLACGMSREEL